MEVRKGRATPLNLVERVDRVLGRIDPKIQDRSFADWLARQKTITPRDRALVKRHVEGFHASELERIGIRGLVESSEDSGGGGGNIRHQTIHGFDRVPSRMRERLGSRSDVRLGVAVREVRWGKTGSRIAYRDVESGEDRVLAARFVVVTLPLGVLQRAPDEEGSVRFDPPLPHTGRALHTLAMGDVLKVVLRFREPILEERLTFPETEAAEQREHKLFLTDQAFPVWWTPSPLSAPYVTGWAGGGAARRARGAGEPLDVAIASLARMVRGTRATIESLLLGAHFHDWKEDRFSCGAYSYVPVGGIPAQQALRRPVEKVLFFAGEATATGGWNGTVDGAIKSGQRAARQLLKVSSL